jgi:predicted GH43/DUF377 family glycosyl hydrolase
MSVKIKWKKLGLILKPSNYNFTWWKSYGMDPSVIQINKSIHRIFFCGRNSKNQSVIGSADIDLNFPTKILCVKKKPIMLPGALGSFDDNGVTASCAVRNGKKIFLYYIGWKPKSTTRYSLMAGLAISNDNGNSFERFSRAPILNLTDKEPYSILTAPYVLKVKKNKWLMWYVSCEEWKNENFPIYNIKIAESKNGLHWNQKGKIAINLKKGERAVARPSVFIEKRLFKMYYCYEKIIGQYRIGYAESNDGISWIRKDKLAGITISNSKEDWDSKMVAYPYIVSYKKDYFMFYNGNEYGKDGVGLAILKSNK